MKKILIAPDKFKGSLTAKSICKILKGELLDANPDWEIEICPLADGGDGSVEILADYLSLTKVDVTSVDPLGRQIDCSYYVSKDTAFIELASASGLVLLDSEDRNPTNTTTYGTGLLMKDAIKNGKKNIYLFLGGSATNDGGIGIATALGVNFFDKDGMQLEPIGKSLVDIDSITTSDLVEGFRIHLFCDVNNLPYGSTGASYTYGPQKGGNEVELDVLENGIKNLCHQIFMTNGSIVKDLKGGGAAGAVAVSMVGLFDANMISGIEYMSAATNLSQKIKHADVVITGEGKIDNQSMNGKVISGVARICQEFNKRLYLVAGQSTLTPKETERLLIDGIYTISEFAKDIEDAMTNSETYLKEIGRKIAIEL